MIKQRKTSKNLGKDTHVRNYQGNKFKEQSSKTFQLVAGEVKIIEPEPLYRQNMVTVALGRGGDETSVAYPGAFIDPVTGNLHGTYEGPIPGQMVMVGYENGNSKSPFVVNRYPYQGAGNTLFEPAYINPLTRSLIDSTDVIVGHFTGSSLRFNTGILSGQIPGSVTLNATTNFDLSANTTILLSSLVTAEMSSLISKVTGITHIELNGNTNFAIKYIEMKTAFDLMKTEINNNLTLIQTAIAGVGGSYTPVPVTADMSGAQNLKVLM
ncbi:MAG: hypothetical protein ACXAC7_24220 [Candidatus Hodarchaeales archaeon]|jgi:hypothetical protein